MQLEKNGNYVIEDIKFLKNCIILVIDSEEWKISKSTYSHFYLYKDKKLSQEELDEILIFQEKSKLIDYVFSLVSKGMYTQKQIEDKLKKKKAKKEVIKEIIDLLIERKYIDDVEYSNEAKEIYERKKYGKNKIINKLVNDGIKKEIISNLEFENEKEKIIHLGNKYIEMHKNNNLNQMKSGLYRYLVSNGFENEDISACIDVLMASYDCNEEEILEKILKKYVMLHHFDINDLEDKEKVVSYLLRKGYRYEDINNVLRRFKDEIC